MSSDPTTLESFSDRQVLPGSDGQIQLATWSGQKVRLRKLTQAGLTAEQVHERQRSLSSLSHPSIVIDLGVVSFENALWVWRAEYDGRPAVATETERRLAFAQRLCEALGQFHRLGIGHGAVDDAHLALTPDGSLKLVDVSYELSASPAQDMLALGHLLFQWETRQQADALSDTRRAAALMDESRSRPLPPRLSRLILGLLAGIGEGQQSNQTAPPENTAFNVAEELEDIRLSLARADAQVLAHWKTENIAPVVSQPAHPDGKTTADAEALVSPPRQAATTEPTASRWPLFAASAVAGILLLGIIYVVGVLPQRVAPEVSPEPQVVKVEVVPDPTPVAAQPAPLSQADLERMLHQREAAQAILDELINLQLELEEQQVERWARRAFTAAADKAAQGDEPFRAQAFERALTLYTEALNQMRSVAALRPIVVAEALERGVLALKLEQSEQADDAFSLALAIEPDNTIAVSGKARAQTLDQVTALMADAHNAMKQDDMATAKTSLEQVIALDPLTENASQMLAQVETQLADGQFRAAMSEGLGALAGGRFSAARSALNRATAMRPTSQAPRDALIELGRRERDSQIGRDSALARSAVEQERWEAAIKHFEDILARDANSRPAQEGMAQAQDRLDLETRLLAMLNDPSSLWSDKGRAQSRSLLYDARSFDSTGPRLNAQLTQLEQQIDLAAQPQRVTIESDRACNVVVYKVAKLGQFEQHQLELLPGSYTAVGTRDGYRDVRVEFMVPAGKSAPAVELRCEEQVLARG